jgi:SAM-dependent methyltransferase
MSIRSAAGRLKRAVLGSSELPSLNVELAAMEHIVRAPPMTPELMAAIQLIAPHYQNVPAAKLQAAWEADQNAACWAEYLALKPILDRLPSPKRILELGPGMGRSIIFFAKKLEWDGDDIHAWEGEGTTTRYTYLGPRFTDSFCGNLQQLRAVLAFNDVSNVTLHDASRTPLDSLPGPFNLVYSFYSIGFHWALEHFLDDILPLMSPGGFAIFTLGPGFKPSPRISALDHEIITAKSPLRKRNEVKLIALRT